MMNTQLKMAASCKEYSYQDIFFLQLCFYFSWTFDMWTSIFLLWIWTWQCFEYCIKLAI